MLYISSGFFTCWKSNLVIMLSSGLLLSGLLGLGLAQFPPTPEGLKVLKSKFQENVTISYKEVQGYACLLLPWLAS